MLHANELPLRHLLLFLDGQTAGPRGFSGEIGKLLETCDKLPVVQFQPIEGELLDVDVAVVPTKNIYMKHVMQYLLESFHLIFQRETQEPWLILDGLLVPTEFYVYMQQRKYLKQILRFLVLL